MKKIALCIVSLSVPILLNAADFVAAGNITPKDLGERVVSQARDLVLTDNGRKVIFGLIMQSDDTHPSKIYYTDVNTLAVKERAVPLLEYFTRNPAQLISGGVLQKNSPDKNHNYTLHRVVYYDEENARAGLIVNSNLYLPRKYHTVFRSHFLEWDLSRNEIISCQTLCEDVTRYYNKKILDDKDEGTSFVRSYAVPVDYNRKTGKSYIYIMERPGTYNASGRAEDGKEIDITLCEVDGAGIRKVATFREKAEFGPRMYYDSRSETILSARHVEFEKNGDGRLIDLKTGKMTSLVTPLLTYDMVFDPDGIRMYVLSSKSGMIWVIDRRNGKKIQEIMAGRTSFKIGFVKKEELAFFDIKGIKLISTKGTLKLIKSVQAAKVIPAKLPLWPMGGIITEGNIIIGWDRKLFHVKYR